jgi:glucose-6-phosphate 1-dehydrogenase
MGVTEALATDNPLAEGLEPPVLHGTSLIIFGATGDLARRKLLPAIYNLAHDGSLPTRFGLVGVARSSMDDEDFRSLAADAVRQFSRRPPNEDVLARLLEDARYLAGGFDDASVYASLSGTLARFDEAGGAPSNCCFYLSTAPRFFGLIIARLGAHGLSRREGAATRVVIEKPFGTSLAEARQLNREVLAVFPESDVFRIDHYLGKETVQNLLTLRFANGIFEPLWNRNHIDHVQITAAEDDGVGSRADYYDQAGALRDLVQNHLLQLLCHVAMEPPIDFTADEVRNEKSKVLRAIDTPSVADVPGMAARAQYEGRVVGGKRIPGYLEEPGVASDSRTETFAALRLEVDNWRWAGVPFYLRTGKRLARKVTEIVVGFRPAPHPLLLGRDRIGGRLNQLILTIQPDEGVALSLGVKVPGTRMLVRPVSMDFLYGAAFPSQSPEAYERLLLDAMYGDPTLFTRNDEIEEQWRICDPILRAWAAMPGPLPTYPAESQGPPVAASILLPGHAWRRI